MIKLFGFNIITDKELKGFMPKRRNIDGQKLSWKKLKNLLDGNVCEDGVFRNFVISNCNINLCPIVDNSYVELNRKHPRSSRIFDLVCEYAVFDSNSFKSKKTT